MISGWCSSSCGVVGLTAGHGAAVTAEEDSTTRVQPRRPLTSSLLKKKKAAEKGLV